MAVVGTIFNVITIGELDLWEDVKIILGHLESF